MDFNILNPPWPTGRNADDMGMPGVIAPPDPTGPLPVVGSGGVVGLRAESVTTLIERWAKHASQWKTDASNHRRSKDPAAKISAERCEGRAAIYAACIEDMRAEMASANVRQPEPNTELTGPKGPV